LNTNFTQPENYISQTPAEKLVGRKLRDLRNNKGLSLRALAELSGLNVNTLSLVENGKSSPSVGTLQQLAQALNVPLTYFFETEQEEKKVVFTQASKRPSSVLGSSQMQNLGKELAGKVVQPFAVSLQPGMGSGDRLIVHTGHEFVYCLEGNIHYKIDQEEFQLNPGDSLLFEAHLPHCWENKSKDVTKILLILYPSDQRDEPGGKHFSISNLHKELTMKIAVITNDGKTISQHFGRAPYYLVVTIEEGKVIHTEMREKMGHRHFVSQQEEHEQGSAEHGMDAGSHRKHSSMAETISDCVALICGGMGRGAYESMRQLNIKPIVTDLSEIDLAVQAFIKGELIDHTELLH